MIEIFSPMSPVTASGQEHRKNGPSIACTVNGVPTVFILSAPAGVQVEELGIYPGSGWAPVLGIKPEHGRLRESPRIGAQNSVLPSRNSACSLATSAATRSRAHSLNSESLIARPLRAAHDRKAKAERACEALCQAVRVLPEGVFDNEI